MKSLDKGRKFQEGRYLSSDDIFTAELINLFHVKGKCRASMKKGIREMNIVLTNKHPKLKVDIALVRWEIRGIVTT